MRTRSLTQWLAGAGVAALLLAACADDDGETPTPEDPAAENGDEDEADPDDPDPEDAGPDDGEQDILPLGVGTFQSGVTGMVWSYIMDENLDAEFGLDLDITFQTSPTSQFGDLAAGVYPVATGSYDVYAGMAAEGLPLELVASIAPNSTFIIGYEDIDDVSDLAGTRIAATTGTGAYRLAEATLSEWYDFDLEGEAEVMPADNPGAAVAQLLAGTADFALLWEPAVTQAMMSDDDVRIVYDQRADWTEREDTELWQFALVQRTDMDVPAEATQRLIDLLAFASEEMMNDIELAEHYAVTVLDAEPGLYAEAIESGRVVVEVLPSEGEVLEAHRNVVEFQQRHGLVPEDVPASYWRD